MHKADGYSTIGAFLLLYILLSLFSKKKTPVPLRRRVLALTGRTQVSASILYLFADTEDTIITALWCCACSEQQNERGLRKL